MVTGCAWPTFARNISRHWWPPSARDPLRPQCVQRKGSRRCCVHRACVGPVRSWCRLHRSDISIQTSAQGYQTACWYGDWKLRVCGIVLLQRLLLVLHQNVSRDTNKVASCSYLHLYSFFYFFQEFSFRRRDQHRGQVPGKGQTLRRRVAGSM